MKRKIFKKFGLILFGSILCLSTVSTVSALGEADGNETVAPPATLPAAPSYPNPLDHMLNKMFGPKAAAFFRATVEVPTALYGVKYIYQIIKPVLTNWIISPWNGKRHGFRSEGEIHEKLTTLFETIEGQNSAKAVVYSTVNKMLFDIENYRRGVGNLRRTILVLNGPSGTGKTMMATGIMNSFFKHPGAWCVISPNMIDRSRTDLNAKQQLFGDLDEQYRGESPKLATPKKNVVQFLVEHYYGAGIVFDEYDKTSGRKKESRDDSLDELLRGLGDRGVIEVDSASTIHVPYLLVVLTTNQLRTELANEDSNGSGETNPADDRTEVLSGTTSVKYSRSLLNRFKVASFTQLTSRDNRAIISKILDSSRSAINEKYQVKIKIDKSAVDKATKTAGYSPGGVHVINRSVPDQMLACFFKLNFGFTQEGRSIQDSKLTWFHDPFAQVMKFRYSNPEHARSAQIVFEKPNEWEEGVPHVYAYFESEAGAPPVEPLGPWPGQRAIKCSDQDDEGEREKYKVIVPRKSFAERELPVRVLFNNGVDGEQIPSKGSPGFPARLGEEGTFTPDEGWQTRLLPKRTEETDAEEEVQLQQQQEVERAQEQPDEVPADEEEDRGVQDDEAEDDGEVKKKKKDYCCCLML